MTKDSPIALRGVAGIACPIRLVSAMLVFLLHFSALIAAPAQVEFAGANSFSAERLRRVLSEQLGEIASGGITPARADDAAWFLGAFYRRQGFPSAEVTFQIRGPTLVLNVREGVRAIIQSLRFTGNTTFPEKTLFEFMVGVAPDALAKAQLPFTEAEVAAGADRVRDFYASEGFLAVEVDTSGTRLLAGGRDAALLVRIVEGPRSLVGELRFTGTPLFERQELIAALALKPDAPFSPTVLDDIDRNLRSFFRSKGHFSAQVTATAEPQLGGRVPITIDCNPGPQFRIGKVEVRGTDRLAPVFMEKRFASLRGQIYDPAKLEERHRQLLTTRLFNTLRVRPVPQAGDVLLLDVEVEEAKAKVIGFDLGYGSYDGISAGVQIGDRNFLGTGRSLMLETRYSQRGFEGELVHMNPWLWDSEWSLRSGLFSLVRDELGYSKVSRGARFDLKRLLAPTWEFGAHLLVENTQIDDIAINEALIGPTEYLLAAVGLSQTFDHRDDPLNPTRGWIFSTSADLNMLDGKIAFARAAFRYSWYRSFGTSLIGFGLRAGWLIPTDGGANSIPIDLRYFNGGNSTVRSFAERRLGPQSLSDNPLGGELITVANIEWDFPIRGAFGGALFCDAGSLSSNTDFSFNDLRYAIGAGLRYQLPIGPIRLDYGYNPSPRAGEAQGAFHLSFGFAF